MELPSKSLNQIAHTTRPKIVLNKSTHEAHLSQPLHTNSKRFKIAVTFVTDYNGIFNVTNSNNLFNFVKPITDGDGFFQISIPPVA